ncbi:MAG: sulfatase [Verrucomicrobiota bacterium]
MLRHLAPFALSLFAAITSMAGPSGEPPNILFIAVDDLRPEIGAYGTRAITPHIDALAASGLKFDRAYCNQAVCGASRVSLMTGLYPEHTGERSFHVTDWRKRWESTVTLNQHFKAHGYQTVGLGKIYHNSNGPGVDPENWTEWIPVRGTQYANPESREDMRVTKSAAPGGKPRRRGPSTESGNAPDDPYADGQRARVGAAKLTELAKAEKPFFLAVGFTKPHLPFVAPKKFWDLYKRDDFAMPPNRGVPPGYPDYARESRAGELRSYSDIPTGISPTAFPEALNQRLIHGYHACVSYMDDNVGRLLEALEKSGKADETIVLFWADHGWKLGDHSSWCKHTNFECDTRVPLIVRLPEPTAARGTTQSLVELVDLYPTLCDLAGLEKPAHLQGRSFLPTLKKAETPHREFAYSSYPHRRKNAAPVTGHSLRTADFRYTEWWEKGTDKVVGSALTNLTEDPGETTSALPESKSEAENLSQKLRARALEVRKN